MTDPVCRLCHRPIGQHGMDTADICNTFIAEGPDDIVGHKTFSTGDRDQFGLPVYRHEPLTRSEADEIHQSVRKAEQERAERMPDEQAAIKALFDAWLRLKDFGWREPSYCPKDGSSFKVIELGSTGIFDCYYQGEWPDGLYMVSDESDVYPTSNGVAMFKLLPEDEEKRKQRMAEARDKYRASLAFSSKEHNSCS